MLRRSKATAPMPAAHQTHQLRHAGAQKQRTPTQLRLCKQGITREREEAVTGASTLPFAQVTSGGRLRSC